MLISIIISSIDISIYSTEKHLSLTFFNTISLYFSINSEHSLKLNGSPKDVIKLSISSHFLIFFPLNLFISFSNSLLYNFLICEKDINALNNESFLFVNLNINFINNVIINKVMSNDI